MSAAALLIPYAPQPIIILKKFPKTETLEIYEGISFGASVRKRLRYCLQSDPAVENLALHTFLSAEQGVRQ